MVRRRFEAGNEFSVHAKRCHPVAEALLGLGYCSLKLDGGENATSESLDAHPPAATLAAADSVDTFAAGTWKTPTGGCCAHRNAARLAGDGDEIVDKYTVMAIEKDGSKKIWATH